MDCMIGNGSCRVKRELLYWRKMAYCGFMLAILNFAAAWFLAFCSIVGVTR